MCVDQARVLEVGSREGAIGNPLNNPGSHWSHGSLYPSFDHSVHLKWNEDYRLSCDGIEPVAMPHWCVCKIKLTTWEEWVWRNRRSVSCLMLNNHSIKQENVLATHKVHMSILAWVHLFWWTHFSRAKWSTALYTLVTCHGWCWSIARRSPVLLSTGTYSALPLFSLFKPIFWHSMLKCIIGKYENAVQSQHCTVS